MTISESPGQRETHSRLWHEKVVDRARALLAPEYHARERVGRFRNTFGAKLMNDHATASLHANLGTCGEQQVFQKTTTLFTRAVSAYGGKGAAFVRGQSITRDAGLLFPTIRLERYPEHTMWWIYSFPE